MIAEPLPADAEADQPIDPAVSCSARFAGHYHLGVARPVPENTFSRTAREQLAHLACEVVKTISEQVWRREVEGQVTGRDGACGLSRRLSEYR